MERLTRTLEAMAARGTPRGSVDLIDRLEAELVRVRRPRRLTPIARPTLRWWQGVGVATATASAILVIVLVGIVLINLTDEEPDAVNPSPTTLVPGPELFEGVIIPMGSSIEIVGTDQYVALLEDLCCPVNVFSDLTGGVVFQEDNSSILWSRSGPEGIAPPSPVLRASAGRSLTLEGIAVIGDEPTLVVLDTTTTEAVEPARVLTVGLDTGTQASIDLPYGAEVTVDRVSYGGDFFVVSLIDNTGNSRFEFLNRDGSPAPVSANPHATSGESLVRQAVLSEDGSLLAYIERQPSALTGGKADLVIVEMESGGEVDRRRVMDLGDRIVAFDGTFVVIARQLSDPTATPVVVVLHLPSGSWAGSGG
ncbi:MAG: hypothetical protein R3258_04030, partial [Acidimicrobiia bacterium]|nr:hypothetical protein [Acidimicrobiia bacterium]